MAKEINVHITTETDKQKVDEYGAAFDSAGKKVSEAGGHAEGATWKMNLLGNAVGSITGFLTGLVSIAGLWAFFQKWLGYIKAISEAQKELVESTKSLDQAAKSLASQADVMGAPGGVEAAREQILQIQTAGKLGSFEAAEGVAVSAHAAFGTSGQLLTPEQLAIAGSVAGFAQREDVSTSSLGNIFKLLGAMGVKTEQEAQRRLEQLSTAQQASGVGDFDAFMPVAIKSIMPALSAGASPEMAMAQLASALRVLKPSERFYSVTDQTSAMLLQPGVVKAIGGGFENLPYDQQITAFGQWVAGSSKQQLMDAGISPEQVGQLKTIYSPVQLPRIQESQELFMRTTDQQFRDKAAVWSQATQGKIEAWKAEAERAAATATPEERIGDAIIEAGKAKWKRIKGDRGETMTRLEDEEISYETVWEPLWKRYEALQRDIDEGRLPEDKQEEIDKMGMSIFRMKPRLAAMSSAKVGRANTMLESLEKQAGITINNYNYNSGPVFARPGVDPTPRVSRGDIEN
jgi:hypothetical protein